MPLPARLRLQPGTLSVTNGIAVAWSGYRSALLDRAAGRFEDGLTRLTGLPTADRTSPTRLVVDCLGADLRFLTVAEKDAYRLSIDDDGIRLVADGPGGVLHGLSTLLQLVEFGPSGPGMPHADIEDAPRFAWRGLMIDVARHFMAIPTLERQIDAMERVKFNVLHLHLSDAQGFRVESLAYPRLQQIASHGQFYTQAEIRALVRYAADRGVRVVPEFDLPGHSLALVQAYPGLEATDAAHLPPNTDFDAVAIDPTLPATFVVVRRLYREMASLFPDRYFHAGGDEVRPEQWTGNPHIAAYMKRHGFASVAALQGWFSAKVAKMLAADGKTMIGWDEVLAAPVSRNVAVEVWRSSKWIATAARAQHPVVVSSGYYLDLLRPAASHYQIDPLDPTATGLSPEEAALARKKGDPTVDDFMRDPRAMLPADDEHLVLGGEAPLWAENVSDEMLDARLWPRAAAIAERFWSPRSVRDVADMERRLLAVGDRLDALGLEAHSNTDRMISRLAPGRPGPVAVLASAVAPVRNYALNHVDRPVMTEDVTLNGLPEIAAPDPDGVHRMTELVDRYLGGDKAVMPSLRLALMTWRDNDAAFEAVASANAVLAPAIPVSRSLAALGTAGIAAVDRLSGAPGGMSALDGGARVIDQQRRAIAASANTVSATTLPQPPGQLILPGVEAIARLVDAARGVPAASTAPPGRSSPPT